MTEMDKVMLNEWEKKMKRETCGSVTEYGAERII
jgi:hypothetical protein